jgi:toxin ParE1/3/4
LARISFTKEARQDLLDIWLYVTPRNGEAVADRVYSQIEATCRSLGAHPELGRARPEISNDARSIVSERWLVLYRIDDEVVQIVRIMDGVRDITRINWPT